MPLASSARSEGPGAGTVCGRLLSRSGGSDSVVTAAPLVPERCRAMGGSSRSRRSAGFITGTNGRQPDSRLPDSPPIRPNHCSPTPLATADKLELFVKSLARPATAIRRRWRSRCPQKRTSLFCSIETACATDSRWSRCTHHSYRRSTPSDCAWPRSCTALSSCTS
jgi:hypothetical protein